MPLGMTPQHTTDARAIGQGHPIETPLVAQGRITIGQHTKIHRRSFAHVLIRGLAGNGGRRQNCRGIQRHRFGRDISGSVARPERVAR